MTRLTTILLLTTLLASITLKAQTVSLDAKLDNESFSLLSDTLMKREIAFFTIKGSTFKSTGTQSKVELTEVPVRNCTAKEVYLSLRSTFIQMKFKGENAKRTLDSIFLVTHSHFWVKFPGDAYQGLSQNNFCDYNGRNKKAEFFSPYYKAFYSTDKKRLYIYMQGGTDLYKYEVTWIIVNDKYYTRIVDNIL